MGWCFTWSAMYGLFRIPDRSLCPCKRPGKTSQMPVHTYSNEEGGEGEGGGLERETARNRE